MRDEVDSSESMRLPLRWSLDRAELLGGDPVLSQAVGISFISAFITLPKLAGSVPA